MLEKCYLRARLFIFNLILNLIMTLYFKLEECTDPQKLDRKNLTFGVSTKAFLLYKEYQIV